MRELELPGAPAVQNGVFPVTFKSRALRGRADVTLYVPPQASAAANVPLVLLLHGVYGSHWAWTLKGGAHTTLQRLIQSGAAPPMILAMPSDGLWGDGSGYIRHATPGGADFERYIVEDVPACVRGVTPAVTASSPLFITGLSMGGFGALRLGAKYAERFRGVSGHSSITHFSQMSRFVEEPLSTYGEIPEHEQSVLHWMVENREKLPPARFDCGTADALLEDNRSLHRSLETAGIDHVYEEFPGGHEWPYWQAHLEQTLTFFAGCLSG